jgi:hypothetical protein
MVVTCFLTDGEKAGHEAAKFFCCFCKKELPGDASRAAMLIVGHKLGKNKDELHHARVYLGEQGCHRGSHQQAGLQEVAQEAQEQGDGLCCRDDQEWCLVAKV